NPQTDKMSGFVNFEAGLFNTLAVQGAVNVRVVKDRLAIRVAGNVEGADGYTQLVTSRQDTGKSRSTSVRTSILYTPTDDLTVLLKWSYTRTSAFFFWRMVEATSGVQTGDIEAGL